LFFGNEKDLKKLKDNKIDFKIHKEFNDFKVTKINGKFLNKKTREQSLKKKYLVLLN